MSLKFSGGSTVGQRLLLLKSVNSCETGKFGGRLSLSTSHIFKERKA